MKAENGCGNWSGTAKGWIRPDCMRTDPMPFMVKKDVTRERFLYIAELQGCGDRGTFSGMRGYLNENYPSTDRTYDEAMAEIRKEYQKPVFSFEVGQFEVLPDFEEPESFHGISDPVNLKLIKKRVEERGLLPTWEKIRKPPENCHGPTGRKLKPPCAQGSCRAFHYWDCRISRGRGRTGRHDEFPFRTEAL